MLKLIRDNYLVQISLLIFILTILFFSSILLGLTKTSFETLYNAYFNFQNTPEEIVIQTVRVPRAIIAIFIGGALSVSGLLMQSITKNPMASPSLLGINAGASFFVVIFFVNFADISYHSLVWVAFLGAIVSTTIVYLIGGGFKGESSVVRLTLAGAATSALFVSFTQGFLHRNEKTYQEIIFWLTGSVEGRKLSHFFEVFPYIIIGLIIAILISKKLNVFSLGEETAISLGLNTSLLKTYAIIATVLLAGASVAVAGPISLVGLIIPHMTKSFFGVDYKRLILITFLLGAIFLTSSDILARFVAYPNEVPVGIITALIGAPFFIYIARKADR